jgi:hypothetical protein
MLFLFGKQAYYFPIRFTDLGFVYFNYFSVIGY